MDFAIVAANLGIGRDDLVELLEIFLVASQADVEALEAALGAGDWPRAAAAAHSLKGAALNLGIKEIADLARTLEIAAKNAQLAGADGQLAALRERLLELDRAVSPPGDEKPRG
jgi:HPt (histidine-containing phosphotransfer) domain-containing protein